MAKKITYCKTEQEMITKYKSYIENHILDVQEAYRKAERAFHDIFPQVYKNMAQDITLDSNLKSHDQSKYDSNEFWFYAYRFFPVKGVDPESEEVKKRFQLGWLHHVHNNAHHPAHWVLADDGGIKIFDMPDIYIIEMLCDWMAMSSYYNSTTLEYWKSESAQKLPMSEYTKSKVNEFMEWMEKNNVHTLW